MAYRLDSAFETREAFQVEFEDFLRRAAADRKKVVFVIDEAQELTPELFEELERLLPAAGGAAPDDRAPFSVLLVGQLELEPILQDPSHAALAGQIRARCRLRPLTDEEVAKYLAYRGPEPSPAGLRKVLREAKGVPRLIDHVAKQLMVAPARPRPALPPVLISSKDATRSSRRRRARSHGRLQLSRRVITASVGGAVIVALLLGVTGYRVIQARHAAPDTETRDGGVEQAATPGGASPPETVADTQPPSGTVEQAATPSRPLEQAATPGRPLEQAATPGRPSAPDAARETATRGRIGEQAATPGRLFFPNTLDDTQTPIDDETLSDLDPPMAATATRPVLRAPETRRPGSGEAGRPPAGLSPGVTEPRLRSTPTLKAPQPGGADRERRTEERRPMSMSPPAAAAAVPDRGERLAPRDPSVGSTPPSAVTPSPKQPQTPGPAPRPTATKATPGLEERPQLRTESERAPSGTKPTPKPSAGATDSNPDAAIDWLLKERAKPR
jgi:AAA domain-containing protein